MQEVSWPPPDHQKKQQMLAEATKILPNLSGKVHIGKARRQRMDLEFENYIGASRPVATQSEWRSGVQNVRLVKQSCNICNPISN